MENSSWDFAFLASAALIFDCFILSEVSELGSATLK